MPNPVRIYKHKYDGTLKREVEGDLVDVTEDGWLVVHSDRDLHVSLKDGQPAVRLMPHCLGFASTTDPLVWWLFFNERGELDHAHADAALPATLAGRALSFVDLDLDLIVAADMSYYTRDMDEFEANRAALGYPGEVVEQAWRGLLQAKLAVDHRRYPFDGSAERILGRVLAARGPL